jgi:hypothetical protein
VILRGVLIVALLSAGGAYIQTQRLERAIERAEEAERYSQGLLRTVSALKSWAETREAEAKRWRETVEGLEQYEGADDPLNDYERAVFDSVHE